MPGGRLEDAPRRYEEVSPISSAEDMASPASGSEDGTCESHDKRMRFWMRSAVLLPLAAVAAAAVTSAAAARAGVLPAWRAGPEEADAYDLQTVAKVAAKATSSDHRVTVAGLEDQCQTAVPGDPCYQALDFVRSLQVIDRPDLYPGLDRSSSRAAFQARLAKENATLCRPPCMAKSRNARFREKLLAERARRLDMGPTRVVYHQTTLDSCKGIVANGFRPGRPGLVGRGMYFAEAAAHTKWKAQHTGCLIKAEIRLGRTKRVPFNGEPWLSGNNLMKQGYDSIRIPRGIPHNTMPEWVVYFKDQVNILDYFPCHRDGSPRREKP